MAFLTCSEHQSLEKEPSFVDSTGKSPRWYSWEFLVGVYSRLSLNGHLYKTDTSLKRTPRGGVCLSLLPLFDFL